MPGPNILRVEVIFSMVRNAQVLSGYSKIRWKKQCHCPTSSLLFSTCSIANNSHNTITNTAAQDPTFTSFWSNPSDKTSSGWKHRDRSFLASKKNGELSWWTVVTRSQSHMTLLRLLQVVLSCFIRQRIGQTELLALRAPLNLPWILVYPRKEKLWMKKSHWVTPIEALVKLLLKINLKIEKYKRPRQEIYIVSFLKII